MRLALLAASLALSAPGAGFAASTPPPAPAELSGCSELARPMVEPAARREEPVLILAQRAIDRSWGPPEGVPPAVPVPGMLSEGRALAYSAVLPGAGQLYAGQMSGVWFALAEIAGWTGHWIFDRDAEREREHAETYVGAPGDTASAWSYERWIAAGSGRDVGVLQTLYAGDRQAFYDLIVRDPTYLDGWRGPNRPETRADFQHLRDLSDGSVARTRATELGLWGNHLAAAIDGLRAARIHNLPIRRNLELQLKSSWRGGSPAVVAAIERKF